VVLNCVFIYNKCLFRYDAASEIFGRLIKLLTEEDECYVPAEKCVISLPSVVDIYVESITAHLKAALYDEALTLCDTVLSKCSSSLLGCDTQSLQQSQTSSDVSQPSVAETRKRSRDASSTDDDDSVKHLTPIAIAQVALYKTQALLGLNRAQDALSCVNRLVISVSADIKTKLFSSCFRHIY